MLQITMHRYFHGGKIRRLSSFCKDFPAERETLSRELSIRFKPEFMVTDLIFLSYRIDTVGNDAKTVKGLERAEKCIR